MKDTKIAWAHRHLQRLDAREKAAVEFERDGGCQHDYYEVSARQVTAELKPRNGFAIVAPAPWKERLR